MILVKVSIKVLCFVFLFFLLPVFFTKQVSAVTFDQIREVTTTSFIQVLEKIELTFTFKEESKIRVLGKHAERRIDWAEESFDDGDTQEAQDYLDEYAEKKEEIGTMLDQVDEEMVDDFKDQTIVENKRIEEFKNDLLEAPRVIVEETQMEVLEKTWEVVGEIQGEAAAEHFVETIYAPGTGPGGESKVVIEGGELKFAPGTGSGGESEVIESTLEIKINGQGSGDTPNTSSGGVETFVVED